MLYLFLSGYLAPLSVFPDTVQQIALLTPFPYLVYMPAQLLTGGEVAVGRGFLIMSLWGLIFWLICRAGWRLGLRRFSAMGA